MHSMINDKAVTWAVTMTSLNLQDLNVLISMAALLGQDDDTVVTLPDKLAAVYQMPLGMAVDSIDHLERCAFITRLYVNGGGVEHRLNYMQIETIRQDRATRQNVYRPLPASLFEQHLVEMSAA